MKDTYKLKQIIKKLGILIALLVITGVFTLIVNLVLSCLIAVLAHGNVVSVFYSTGMQTFSGFVFILSFITLLVYLTYKS